MKAFAVSFDLPPNKTRQVEKPKSNVDFLNMANESVERCVRMASQLPVFSQLSMDDQIILVKGKGNPRK